MTKIQPLLTWRGAILKSDLEPTTRHVALTLSTYMGDVGESAHPGPTRLAKDTGLSLRTVKHHLGVLVDRKWLVITEHGGLKGEKRKANCYAANVPKTRAANTPVQQKTRARNSPVQETAPTRADDDTSPVQELHPNSSIELSKELSTTETPAAKGKTHAHLLTERHWNETKPKPVLKGGFVALRAIVQKLEDAGHEDEAILRGLRETRAYTLDAIQFSLREAPKKKNGHAHTVDNLRALVSR